jgi:integrase
MESLALGWFGPKPTNRRRWAVCDLRSPRTCPREPAQIRRDRERGGNPRRRLRTFEWLPLANSPTSSRRYRAEDALAWAIAGYATARRQEIEALDWTDVDFGEDAVLLGEDEEARKSKAARRVVPMVRQLRVRMLAERERRGRPRSGPIFKPKRADNRSGTADLNAVLH